MSEHAMFALIVGAGPAGIAMACKLKGYGVDDFIIIDRSGGAGGIWLSNDYPGCGCNIPSYLYSYSFHLNREWTRPMAQRSEILAYLNQAMHDFELERHALYQTECIGATWQQESATWRAHLRDVKTNQLFTRDARLFVTAIGLFSNPRYPDIQGLGEFGGSMWHSASWNHEYNLSGKRIAVIGSGASAMQIIPSIAQWTRKLMHYPGDKRYILKQDNDLYTPFQRWCFRYVPCWSRLLRLKIFWSLEVEYFEHLQGLVPQFLRWKQRDTATRYLQQTAPRKYHERLLPDYVWGCKRHVLDVGYLDCLNLPNVDLASSSISLIDKSGIITADGRHQEFDCIILATGFYASKYLEQLNIHGCQGSDESPTSLHEYWDSVGGPQAYNSISVSRFPNMAILFGPNGASAHSSALFNIETQVNYVCDVYVKTLMRDDVRSIDVKRSAEESQSRSLRGRFMKSKLLIACCEALGSTLVPSCVTFPGSGVSFWRRLLHPDMRSYSVETWN